MSRVSLLLGVEPAHLFAPLGALSAPAITCSGRANSSFLVWSWPVLIGGHFILAVAHLLLLNELCVCRGSQRSHHRRRVHKTGEHHASQLCRCGIGTHWIRGGHRACVCGDSSPTNSTTLGLIDSVHPFCIWSFAIHLCLIGIHSVPIGGERAATHHMHCLHHGVGWATSTFCIWMVSIPADSSPPPPALAMRFNPHRHHLSRFCSILFAAMPVLLHTAERTRPAFSKTSGTIFSFAVDGRYCIGHHHPRQHGDSAPAGS